VKYHRQIGPGWVKPPFFWAVAIFLFALTSFFPNPSLSLGGNTGMQAGQIVALLSVPIVAVWGLPKRQTLALLFLSLPVLVSALLVVVTGHALSNDVLTSSMISEFLVLFVLVLPIGTIVSKRYAVPLLSGAACAIVVHAIVGANQVYWFAQDVFPLTWLYQNPAFHGGVGATSLETWALYVKRPFGLFPEPSAMAASTGPWLVLIVGILLYPRLRYGLTRGTLILLVLAVVSGIGLDIAGQSGYTIWLLASLLLVTLPTLKHNALRLHRPKSLLVLIAFVVIAVATVELYVTFIDTRVNAQLNDSWSARMGSIIWAVSYLVASPSNLLLGLGPGQSYLILNSVSMSNPALPHLGNGGEAVTAVWSIVINYIQETGLLGALAWVLILIMVVQAIVQSSARLIGLGCLVAWLAAVVLTTSYASMLPVWLFLGLLLGWDRLFEARAISKGLNPGLGATSVRRGVKV
jgi:hypothetical protein